MDVAPSGGEPDMAMIQQSRGGSVRFKQDSPVSSLVLSVTPSTSGNRRSDTCMAKVTPVCIPADQTDSISSVRVQEDGVHLLIVAPL